MLAMRGAAHRALRKVAAAGSRASSGGPMRRRVGDDVPDLRGFMARQRSHVPRKLKSRPEVKTFFLETYGCQMNEADSEVVDALLSSGGLERIDDAQSADVILMNTCAVREKAEDKIWGRLRALRAERIKKGNGGQLVGVLGCMAERLRNELLDEETLVNFIAGPDAYRDLPRLIDASASGMQAMNVQLSLEETYSDITPVRPNVEGLSAWLSIMRGCNNMCSFCVVPFTRGRERSRTLEGIVSEVVSLSEQGVKEVTLLGQNVNSYWDQTWQGQGAGYESAAGFSNTYKLRGGGGARFVDLLDAVSAAAPSMRIRFTSPHPKDFPDAVLQLIAERKNICNTLHMPAQSGSTSMLQRMRRGYTREAYLELVRRAKGLIPGLAVTTDIISGFCGETEEEHRDTVSLMREVGYDQAFMFAYSERSKTHASHTMADDVPEEVKLRRLQEVIDAFRETGEAASKSLIGSEHVVLVEGESKRSTKESPQMSGRNDNNKICVWSPADVPGPDGGAPITPGKGTWLRVKVVNAGRNTLYVEPLRAQATL